MQQTTIKALKKGDVFKRRPNANAVFMREDYERTLKRYSCIDYEDINREIFLKGDTAVFIDFDF